MLAVLAALVLAGGVFYWMGRTPVVEIAAPAPPAVPSAPSRDRPALDSSAAAIEAAVGRNVLLDPQTARRLADAWRERGLSLDALDETALLAAIQGIAAVRPEKAEQLGISFQKLYAALPSEEGRAVEGLLASIRNGTARPEDVSRAVQLMDQGARRMDDSSRLTLRDQYSAAILVAITQRQESERLASIPTTLAAPAPAAAVAADAAFARTESAATAPASRSFGTAAAPGDGPATRTTYGGGGGPPASRGEAYWRARAAQLRAAIPAAEARVERTQRELSIAIGEEISGCSGPPRARNMEEVDKYVRTYKCKIVTQADVARARKDADAAQAALEAARKALSELDDEARRDGALPGWIR